MKFAPPLLKDTLALTLLLVGLPVAAQGLGANRLLTVSDVLRLAPESSSTVASAQNEVATAERDLRTLEANPQAVPIELAAARRTLEASQDDLRLAVAQSRLEGFNLFAELLEAQAALEAQERATEIAAISAEATEARYEAGAGGEFARDSLEAFVDVEVVVERLRPVSEASLPEIEANEEELMARANETSGRLRNADRTVADAEEQLAAVDNAFSAAREVEAARDRLEDSRAAASEARHAVRLAVRQAVANVRAAQNRYENAQASQRSSVETLRSAEVRFDAGTISRVALEEARLAHQNTESSLQSALHGLYRALLQLEIAVLE